MTINIGNSSINSIYVGDTEVKSVYLGDNLVYSKQTEPVIEIDDSYNTFVFDTSKVSRSTTVTLQNYRAGDTTEWDGLTDWGDGTVDTKLTHTYAIDGKYVVKTKWTINKGDDGSGDSYTHNMLTECKNINKNITNYNYLFHYCSNLTYVNTNLDTSNVTSMGAMFGYCSKLASIDLSYFNTINVTNMSSMFIQCNALTTLDLSSFNTINVQRMYQMFRYCTSLSYLNLSNWNMDNVTNTILMFSGCTNLTIDNVIMTNCNDATKTKIQEALSAK